jgi:ribosomal protein L5
MGLGKAVTAGEKGKLEQAEKELAVIAGQKPVRCKAKKSVANFKVREGMETGIKVTLRGTRMYEFLDRMITLAGLQSSSGHTEDWSPRKSIQIAINANDETYALAA